MIFTLSEVAEILGSPPPASGDLRVTGYSIDSRTIKPGELFFAVRGKRLDGHDYVKAAFDTGGIAAVVASDRAVDFPGKLRSSLLAVREPLAALQKLAATARRRWGRPVVAVTGSMGKTTTKQMIAALLRTRYKVLENEGNLNNHFGLPLSLLRLEPETEVGVFELGMSGPGEIRLLAELAAPEVGVVTNVGPVHLEFFPDVEAIARAKFELIETLGNHAWAVLNADDPRVSRFGERMGGRFLTFGIAHPADLRAESLSPNGSGGWAFTVSQSAAFSRALGAVREPLCRGSQITAKVMPKRSSTNDAATAQFHLPLLGQHNVLNALAALETASLLGLSPSSFQEAVAGLRPSRMRGDLVKLANGALVVNDCYNSSPEALEAMLMSVASLPARRRIAVLGGMFELGPSAQALHEQCGARVAELGFDYLVTVGDEARGLARGAQERGFLAARHLHLDSPDEAGKWLKDHLLEGDAVLLKASRGVHLEKVWDHLGSMAVTASEATGAEHRRGQVSV
jgi:UDP-N-acetylmuramoyl-tripeptide--D-alanyl-D-alanine ligase